MIRLSGPILVTGEFIARPLLSCTHLLQVFTGFLQSFYSSFMAANFQSSGSRSEKCLCRGTGGWNGCHRDSECYLRCGCAFLGYFFVALCKDCRNCHVVGYLLKIENVGDWEHKDANERIHTPVEMRFEARSSCRVRHVFLKSTKGSCAD